jgi:hypothetical protein
MAYKDHTTSFPHHSGRRIAPCPWPSSSFRAPKRSRERENEHRRQGVVPHGSPQHQRRRGREHRPYAMSTGTTLEDLQSIPRPRHTQTTADAREGEEPRRRVIATPDHTHTVIRDGVSNRSARLLPETPDPDVTKPDPSRLPHAKGRHKPKGIQCPFRRMNPPHLRWIWDGAIVTTKPSTLVQSDLLPFGHAGWSSKWTTSLRTRPPVPRQTQLGPLAWTAPLRPYHPAYHPPVWRCCGLRFRNGRTAATTRWIRLYRNETRRAGHRRASVMGETPKPTRCPQTSPTVSQRVRICLR